MTVRSQWQKSSFSGGGEGNDCVEIATHGSRTAIRDSKFPARATLSVPAAAFTAFVEALKSDPTAPGD
jgi:hypothetical protein